MVQFVSSFLRNESGASAAEYALILAVIGSGIAVSAIVLADSIGAAMERAAATIDSSR